MINIVLATENSSIVRVEVSGHAASAELGKDIVCAGISTVVQTALLGLTKVAYIDVEMVRHDGFIQFTLPKNLTAQQRHDADIVLDTMHVALLDFLTKYKKIIKLEVI